MSIISSITTSLPSLSNPGVLPPGTPDKSQPPETMPSSTPPSTSPSNGTSGKDDHGSKPRSGAVKADKKTSQGSHGVVSIKQGFLDSLATMRDMIEAGVPGSAGPTAMPSRSAASRAMNLRLERTVSRYFEF